MTVNIAVVGLGAFGIKHLDALALIDDVNIQSVGHSRIEVAQDVAAKYGAQAAFTDYAALLAQPRRWFSYGAGVQPPIPHGLPEQPVGRTPVRT